jgi:metallophosphoesterase superfamily enzyme
MGDFRPRIKGNIKETYLNFTKPENRILVIGDLHEPFCLDSYLKFCQDTYKNYNCNKVVFIGDVIDSHFSSFHETDPDGYGAGQELDLAIQRLKRWYKAFPDADVTIGNHDRIAYRKAFSGGIPKRWMKPFAEVLETPNWRYVESIDIDDVLYEHGEGGQALTKAKNNMMSSVCGHTHTEGYVKWLVGKKFKVFAMQVGCGVDASAYATAYARNFKKQVIGCGVVVGGHTAFNVLMDL